MQDSHDVPFGSVHGPEVEASPVALLVRAVGTGSLDGADPGAGTKAPDAKPDARNEQTHAGQVNDGNGQENDGDDEAKCRRA